MELSIFDLRINFIGTMFIVFVKKKKSNAPNNYTVID